MLYLLVTTSPATPMIYSIKFLVFDFLGVYSLVPKSGHYHKNQPAGLPIVIKVLSVIKNGEKYKKVIKFSVIIVTEICQQ